MNDDLPDREPQPTPTPAPPAAGHDGSEPREIELKLEVEADHADQLLAHPLLAGAAAAGSMRATYFDTDDRALRAAGVSLRIREAGGRRVQTAKVRRGAAAGLFDRAEWETAVDGDVPDLAAAAPALEAAFGPGGAGPALRPVFEVAVERRTVPIATDRIAADVILDRGRITTGNRAEPLCELELELSRGDPAELFALARRLAEAVPLHLGIRTKADRGYALLDGAPLKALKAEPVVLRPGMSAAEAFRRIARSCLAHALANELVLRTRRDPEAVHQMRVAIRRLRAALTIFRDVAADDALPGLKEELKRVAGALGEARDLDVYLAKTLRRRQRRHPDEAALTALRKAAEGEREAAYDRALGLVQSERFRLFVLDLAAWIETGAWQARDGEAAALRDEPVETFAARDLAQRRRKVRRRGRGLADLDAERRHKVRIEVKKLRYAAEFFGSLFEGDKARTRRERFLEALEALQEDLGSLNDMAVSEATTARLAARAGLAGDGSVSPGKRTVRKLIGSAAKAYDRLADAKRFWPAG